MSRSAADRRLDAGQVLVGVTQGMVLDEVLRRQRRVPVQGDGGRLIDLILDPAVDGRPLALEFQAAPGSAAAFSVQMWALKDRREGPEPQPVPTPTASPEILETADPGEAISYEITAIDTAEADRLGVIITRVDTQEHSDPIGAYTIFMR